MSDSKLHLMSFAPVPDTKTTVHVVGLPDSLRHALYRPVSVRCNRLSARPNPPHVRRILSFSLLYITNLSW